MSDSEFVPKEFKAVIHPYTGDRNKVTVDAEFPQMTKQSFRDSTDINKLVGRFVKSGLTPPLPADQTFGFAPDLSFQEALELVREADAYFDKLPAEARKRFGNDAGAFLSFIDDPANQNELYEMGLLERAEEAVEAVVEAPVEPSEPPE